MFVGRFGAMILALLILTLFLGIFLVAKKVQNGKQKDKQNLPPGPWGLPFLGHLVFLGLNPHLTLIKWKKKYGPIISCRFGSFSTVVLCDSKLIKEAFNMSEFSGRPQIQVLHENMGKGVIFTEGPYNTELRHFTSRKLKEFGMGRRTLELEIHKGISEFMDFMKMREGSPIKSHDIPSAHIIQTLWSTMMTGEPDPKKMEHMNHLLSKIFEVAVLSDLAGFMPWIEKTAKALSFGSFSFISSKVKQMRNLQSFISKLMEEKKRKWPIGPGQNQGQVPIDIMDMYLEKVTETTDESSPFHASQESAENFLSDVFAAGIHTFHATLVWTFNYTARNPEVQLKLQEEIDQVIGNLRLPSLSDRGHMPYTDAFGYELLRMSSVVPLFLPHNTTADISFHGYTIKKDTMIFGNAYGVHHDPEIWGDPENFRPERWFSEQGKKMKSENFLAFSTGRRNCLGEALARDQLFLYVTTLFQKYSVEFPLGNVPEVKGVYASTLHASEFTVVCNERKMQ